MSGLETLQGGRLSPLRGSSYFDLESHVAGCRAPLVMPDEVTGDRDRFEAAWIEDSLLSHARLAVGAVSSIHRDFDLRKVDALSIEEALALLLQGTASVHPSAFVDLCLNCFSSIS